MLSGQPRGGKPRKNFCPALQPSISVIAIRLDASRKIRGRTEGDLGQLGDVDIRPPGSILVGNGRYRYHWPESVLKAAHIIADGLEPVERVTGIIEHCFNPSRVDVRRHIRAAVVAKLSALLSLNKICRIV